MRLSERQQQILSIINRDKFVTVNGLCGQLFSSPATIRRDLRVLEDSHSIRRVFGGAVPISGNDQESPFSIRLRRNNPEKIAIAQTASQFVENASTIILDASTTTTYLVRHLESFQHLTVLTNSLEALSVLSNMSKVKTIMTGGVVVNGYELRGILTQRSIEQYNADLLFISCGAVSCENGVSYTSEDSASIRQLMANHAKKKILLCDSFKFDRSYFFRAFSIKDFDHIVCNTAPQNQKLRDLMGDRLVCSDDSHKI